MKILFVWSAIDVDTRECYMGFKSRSSYVFLRMVFEEEDLRGEIHPTSRICAAIDRAKNDSFILPCSSLTFPIAKFVLRGERKEEVAEKLFKEKIVSSEKAAKDLINSIPLILPPHV